MSGQRGPRRLLEQGIHVLQGRVSAGSSHPSEPSPLSPETYRPARPKQVATPFLEDALAETAHALVRIKEQHGARAVGFGGWACPKGLSTFILMRLANIFGSPMSSPPRMSAMRRGNSPESTPAGSIRWPISQPDPGSFSPGQQRSFHQRRRTARPALPWNNSSGGARLIVVDPARTELAPEADRWAVAQGPGTAQALALGFLQ